MGRKKKYDTAEERKAARRQQAMNYYYRNQKDIQSRQNAKYAATRLSCPDKRNAKDLIVPAKHSIPTPADLYKVASDADSKLDAMTHKSLDAFALQSARRALHLSADQAHGEMSDILRRLIAMHETAASAKNAMFTHHGRQYQEWMSIQAIDERFNVIEEYFDSIIRCLNDGTLKEYLDEKIFAFCPL